MSQAAFPIASQPKNHSSPLMVGLLFFYGFISWSLPVGAMGVRGSLLVPIIIVVLGFVCLTKRRQLRQWFLLLFLAVLTTAFAAAYLWQDVRIATVPMYLLTALALLSSATLGELGKMVDLATRFMNLILIGAIVGFFIALTGVGPLIDFGYGQESRSYLYVTTLTNSPATYIRPAGIYDEPGALSFAVCVLAFMRRKFNKDEGHTWRLLWLGLITFSLMHLLFMITFLLSSRAASKKLMISIIVLPFAIAVGSVVGLTDAFNEHVSMRLQIDSSGKLAGDNRSLLFENALQTLEDVPGVFLRGLGPDCLFGNVSCAEEFGNYGANPLALLVGNGILNSWPYFGFVLIGVITAFRSRDGLAFLGVTLMLLQRPYLLSLGYALLGVVSMWLHLQSREYLETARTLAGKSTTQFPR
jgi:hypothetical protein